MDVMMVGRVMRENRMVISRVVVAVVPRPVHSTAGW